MFASERIVRGGDIWKALVGDTQPGVSFHQVFHHPLFVGVSFELKPHSDSLTVTDERTYSFNNAAPVPPETCRRNGCIYDASLRAGRREEWGPLLAGRVYYIWATWDLQKAFALRQPTTGTCRFVFDNINDCLVRQQTPNEEPQPKPPNSKALNVTKRHQASVAPTREELRAKRLASMGEASPATSHAADKSRAADSLLLQFSLEPTDQLEIFAGETVILMVSLPIPTMQLSFQWHHSREHQQCGTPVLGATRPVLRLSALGVVQEGHYWCSVTLLSDADSTLGDTVMAIVSKKAKVAFAPLDRFVLEQFENVASFAEEVLPLVENMHLLSNYSRADHVDWSTQVGNAKHVISRVNATLSLSDATHLGSPAYIQERVRKLCEQLPCEVSGLLTLRARAHLACTMWAMTQCRKDEATEHAQHSRCDASAALKLLPGDRDALRSHAAACEQCDRIGDAVDSLERLLRITPLNSPLYSQYHERLINMQNKLDIEWKRHRAKTKAEAASKGGNRHGFCGWQKTETSSENDQQPSHKGDAADERHKKQQRKQSPEATPPSNAKGAGAGNESKRSWRGTFDQQEEQWDAFVHRLKHSTNIVLKSLHDVPWPSGSLRRFHFVGVDNEAPRQEKRKAVKKMLLRWHPDKFCTFISKFASEGLLGEFSKRALSITRRLTELSEVTS